VGKQPSSEWWARITHAFQVHVREEETFLESYRELVHEIGEPGMRFLVELILEDEERHHALMERMAHETRGDHDIEPTPEPPHFTAEEAARLLEPTERFYEAEREDREKLAALIRDLRPVRDDTLWSLLVELMEIDTQKHVKILDYLRRRLREAAK
jgi:rubrerythrin